MPWHGEAVDWWRGKPVFWGKCGGGGGGGAEGCGSLFQLVMAGKCVDWKREMCVGDDPGGFTS